MDHNKNNFGCEFLLDVVKRIKPKYHIFGHIHQSYGIYINDSTTFANASICNEKYNPINEPIVLDLPIIQ